METTSQFSSTTSLVDTMASPPDFLKLEDLYSTPPPSTSCDNMARQQTPPPVIVKSHPAKKRKSWGQQLPEPSTDLPPRKRAKTDDEKEQRRIERIKRNRAAAHNSRERKRQETDVLAVALARANAELDAYRKLHGPLPPSVVLPEVTLCVDDDTQTPAPSLVGSRGSVDLGASRPSSPHDTLFDYPMDIKQEKVDETPLLSSSLPAFDTNISKPTPLLLDPTQHSAAMLCDLQCRSSSSKPASTLISWWTNLFLYLTTLQFQTSYKAILVALWTISPSRMARLMQASTLRLTSRSTTLSMTPRLLRSTMVLAQRNAATTMATRRDAATAVYQRRSADRVRDARVGQAEETERQMTAMSKVPEDSNANDKHRHREME